MTIAGDNHNKNNDDDGNGDDDNDKMMVMTLMMVMVMMIQNAVKSVGRFGVVLARRPSRPAHRHDLMKSTQSDYQHYRQHQNEDVRNGKKKTALI